MDILFIEDDEDLGSAVVEALERHGYRVRWERDGRDGLYRAREWDPDLVILDRMLPGLSGMDVLEGLRRKKRTPVLMLTALNTAENRVEGLETGADDYLGKPFDLAELLARIRALLRRSADMADEQLRCGDLRLLPFSRQVFRGERELTLTPVEYDTLELLLQRRGRVVSRLLIEDRMTGGEDRDVPPGALDVHMHRLRKKVGADLIRTRRGQGYLIQEPGCRD